MSDNKKVDEFIKHYIDLEYYANGVTEEIMDYLADTEGECNDIILSCGYLNTKKEYSDASKKIKDKTDKLADKISKKIDETLNDVTKEELAWIIGFFAGAVIYHVMTSSKVGFTPYNGKDTIDSFLSRFRQNTEKAYDNAMRSGYTFAQSGEDIKKAASQNMAVVERSLKSDVQTMTTSFAKTTDRIVFLNNKDAINDWVWIATLDESTCIVCAELSGKRYKKLENAEHCPVHNRCRCILYPEIGEHIEVPTFKEWMDRQNESTQKEVLGKSRYEMYKNGMKLENFVNNGKIITLKELRGEQ